MKLAFDKNEMNCESANDIATAFTRLPEKCTTVSLTNKNGIRVEAVNMSDGLFALGHTMNEGKSYAFTYDPIPLKKVIEIFMSCAANDYSWKTEFEWDECDNNGIPWLAIILGIIILAGSWFLLGREIISFFTKLFETSS